MLTCCRRLAGDLRRLAGDLQATCRQLAATCRRLAGNLQATYRRLAGDLQATCGDLQATYRQGIQVVTQRAPPQGHESVGGVERAVRTLKEGLCPLDFLSENYYKMYSTSCFQIHHFYFFPFSTDLSSRTEAPLLRQKLKVPLDLFPWKQQVTADSCKSEGQVLDVDRVVTHDPGCLQGRERLLHQGTPFILCIAIKQVPAIDDVRPSTRSL